MPEPCVRTIFERSSRNQKTEGEERKKEKERERKRKKEKERERREKGEREKRRRRREREREREMKFTGAGFLARLVFFVFLLHEIRRYNPKQFSAIAAP